MAHGVAISPGGDIFITDSYDDKIFVFSQTGELIRSFGGEGDTDGKLGNPINCLFNSDGNFVVVDNRNKRVQIFDEQGSFISKFKYGVDLRGISIDLDENYVICDFEADHILVVSPKGTLIREFGEPGYEGGLLCGPIDVEVDTHGDYFVLELGKCTSNLAFSIAHPGRWLLLGSSAILGNCKISVFNPLGQFIRSIGSEDNFSCPTGLLVDRDGGALVIDSSDNKLKRWSPSEGLTDFPLSEVFLILLGRFWEGGGNDLPDTPDCLENIAVTQDGVIIVTDPSNRRILFFE